MEGKSIEKIKDYDVFADFGNGDIFYLKDFEVDEENKKIVFKGYQGQVNWIKIDALYPIKYEDNRR